MSSIVGYQGQIPLDLTVISGRFRSFFVGVSRLPTIKELAYIVNYSIPYPGPTIDVIFFPNTMGTYLSSTINSPSVYCVDFSKGYVGNDSQSISHYVRAVRGKQDTQLDTINLFTDNDDGTVTDNTTGLMWQQDGLDYTVSWEDALSYCENLELGGHTNWRLPTIKELRSLVDYSQNYPSINTSFFPDTQPESDYWSSTTNASDTSIAWEIWFYWGKDYLGFNKKMSCFVRAVRDNNSDNSVLSVTPMTRTVSTDAGSTIFSVSNNGTGSMLWSASVLSGGNWLSITSGDSGSNSGTITCYYTANTDEYSRTATILVSADNASCNPQKVSVVQNGTKCSGINVSETGQTSCYDTEGYLIACPSSGQQYYGQDGNYITKPISYTKLDSTGNSLDESASSWSMVKDNVTGLIWEVKTNKNGIADYSNPNDADNKYTWYDSNPETNGGDSGTGGYDTDTEDFIKKLNGVNFGGYTDWRLPTINELASIVNYSIPYPGPVIDAKFFPNTQSAYFWSSTSYSSNAASAWILGFGEDGKDGNRNKSNSYYVRAVRGGTSDTTANRFTDNGDGTVTDNTTGLMWQQIDLDYNMTWREALLCCEEMNLGDHTDWRLPTIRELRSLADHTNLSMNVDFFPNAIGYYWASTTSARETSGSWNFDCISGAGVKDKEEKSYVKAVRCGNLNPYQPIQIGIEPGYIQTTVSGNQLVELLINSTNYYGDTPSYEWLPFTATFNGSQIPLYLISDKGVVALNNVISDITNYTFTFNSSALTSIATLFMSDLGMITGDNFIYCYAYQNQEGMMVIDNIVDITVK